MELAEIYSGYIGGDLPIIDVANLWGLFPDSDTNFQVIDATRPDLHRIIEEQSNGVVIMENYYESNYYFSSRPLNSLGDFEGLKTRSHSTVLSDLLDGMGADAQFMAFADVYTGLERGVLDAAVSCGTCGSGVRWYEVTDYLVGPIVAIAVTWITMNKDVWESIPPDLQAIIKEEGERPPTDVAGVGGNQVGRRGHPGEHRRRHGIRGVHAGSQRSVVPGRTEQRAAQVGGTHRRAR